MMENKMKRLRIPLIPEPGLRHNVVMGEVDRELIARQVVSWENPLLLTMLFMKIVA